MIIASSTAATAARRRVRGVCCVGIVAWLCAVGAYAQEAAPASSTPSLESQPLWRPVGRIDRAVLREASGVVASRQYPGVLWVHADSGNQPKLVAISSNGTRQAEVMLAGAPNIDWEDICADDAGNLYVGDIGNNTGMLPVRYVYQVAEPNPHQPPQSPIAPSKQWRVRYADKQRVNCEALFWLAGSLYTVSRGGGAHSTIYRLAPQGESELLMQPVQAAPISGATAADVSADGKTLLICAGYSAHLFTLNAGQDLIDATERRFIRIPDNGGVEACCLTDHDAVLIPENGCVYRVAFSDFDAQTQFRLRQ